MALVEAHLSLPQQFRRVRVPAGGNDSAEVHQGRVDGPDVIAVIKGRFIGIEVKAEKGRQSDNQKEFQRQLEAAGGLYILAKGIDGVEDQLR
jgi:Holliday junction resolvase